jgi:hypothetical protein
VPGKPAESLLLDYVSGEKPAAPCHLRTACTYVTSIIGRVRAGGSGRPVCLR